MVWLSANSSFDATQTAHRFALSSPSPRFLGDIGILGTSLQRNFLLAERTMFTRSWEWLKLTVKPLWTLQTVSPAIVAIAAGDVRRRFAL